MTAILRPTAFLWLLATAVQLVTALHASEKEEEFERRVRPVLIERCHKCHAGSEAKGGLRLDSRTAAMKGGDTGPAIVVGKPEQSLLLQAVRHENGLEMPPDGKL
ncbi:MAG: hypothetical protein RLY70_3730, partial [Planctomycetota bacterium]